MRHFCSIADVSVDELNFLLELSMQLKRQQSKGVHQSRLPGRVLGLLFEKPSLRTRVSLESAMAHLGGASIFMSGKEVGLGRRESIEDVGKIMSTYVDLLAVRTFSHEVVLELAKNAACPVINALSDELHPCQALADILTIQEKIGRLQGVRVVFVGDGNNVARSLALACLYCGMDFVLSSPDGYKFTPDFLAAAPQPGLTGSITHECDPRKAVKGADVVYTDVWASMGQEEEREKRLKIFMPYQVNQELMSLAKPKAWFLHCLPAHRGEEVTAEVLDGAQSIIVAQAANRLHVQKALILWLLTEAR